MKQDSKRVLFITYFWPPSGKASIHWPLHIIRHLPSYGWQPEVLTVANESFTQKDPSLLQEVPEELPVHKARAIEPFDLYRSFTGKGKDAPLVASETISKQNTSLTHRISIWMRMNLFVPDARIGWLPFATAKGKQVLQQRSFSSIVSIGPPHTSLVAGMRLSKKTGLPHIPVFIDPWTDIVYYRGFQRNRAALALDNKLERSVIEQAAAVVYITRSMREHYAAKYPEFDRKANVLYWGYDEAKFEAVKQQKQPGSKALLHAGNIFDYQNPPNLWKTVKRLRDEGEPLRLKFIGTVSPLIKQAVTDAGLDDAVEYAGFLDYTEAVREMMNADYLLVAATEKRHVPGKLFEYLRTGNPVLAFGDDNEEVAAILKEANAGMLLPYHDDALKFFHRADTFRTNTRYTRQFDRNEIAKSLKDLLDTAQQT